MGRHDRPPVTVQVVEMRANGETFAGAGRDIVHVSVVCGLRWSLSLRIDPETGRVLDQAEYPAPAHWSPEVTRRTPPGLRPVGRAAVPS